MTPSTRNLQTLAGLTQTRRLMKSLAMLDAIFAPKEPHSRYYSFNARWDEGEMFAAMRDGCGDEWTCLFTGAGAILSGLAHESPMYRPGEPWPGVFDGVPEEFAGFLSEPAFDNANRTFCIWRRAGDATWSRGPVAYVPGDDPDGSAALLELLDGRPASYARWATEYYEPRAPVDVDAVTQVYAHRPLTAALVARLNPAAALDDLRADIEEIGYPETGPR